MDFLVSESTIQRAIDQARFFVPETNVDAGRFPFLHAAMAKRPEVKPPAGLPTGQAISEAERHRLVKATKCPTQELKAENGRLNFEFSTMMQEKTRRGLAPVLSDVLSINPVTGEFNPQYVTRIEEQNNHFDMDVIEQGGVKCELKEWVLNKNLVPVQGREKETGAGRFAVIGYRDWSNEFRVRTQVEQPHKKPPPQDDIRVTKSLSMGGAVAIADSCHYMSVKYAGYSTFLTLTFDREARARLERRVSVGPTTSIKLVNKSKEKLFLTQGEILDAGQIVIRANKRLGRETVRAAGPCTKLVCKTRLVPAYEPVKTFQHDGVGYTATTLQKEVSRFFDAAQKMYQRGWQPKGGLSGFTMPAHEGKLRYCWVAENPKNEDGKDNPHVHVLMDWRVQYGEGGEVFRAWAARLEGIWGQGFANLEKIKEPQHAGAYMAKAAGYMTKASGASDQGEIYGNRYGISEDSRAPAWKCYGRYALDSMGFLIRDVHDYFSHKYGELFKERSKLNTELNDIKAEQKKLKEAKQATPNDLLARRGKVGEKLQKVRSECNELPAVAGKYQILIKGAENFQAFWDWARDGWRDSEQKKWLPAIDQQSTWDPYSKPDSLWLSELTRRRKKVKYGRWLGRAHEIYIQTVEVAKGLFEPNLYDEWQAMGVASD